MAKFGVLFKYSPEGNRGFLKEGASKRVEAVKKALASAGGHLECLYWIGAGEYSGLVIWDFPDMAAYTAFVTHTQASDAFSLEVKSFQLLTSEEMDEALGKPMSYRPPGG
jgi:uncharacterized protein with GYD domain